MLRESSKAREQSPGRNRFNRDRLERTNSTARLPRRRNFVDYHPAHETVPPYEITLKRGNALAGNSLLFLRASGRSKCALDTHADNHGP
jgi:hypothetical protein